MAEDRNHQDRVNFLKMTLFNFLLGSTDAHLKNFALFHTLEKAGPAHRLTPFYDICPSLLYAPRDTDELGLSLVSRKNRFTKKDFQTLASRLQLGPRSVSAFVKRFKDSRDALIQALDAYEVTQPRQYAVLDLAKRRLEQLNG
ncbi:MAG: HipA domain-containing protein [Proteobacteria bacterium]|nr:HipA domain-containing protein [Pseudomonadota bacterium]